MGTAFVHSRSKTRQPFRMFIAFNEANRNFLLHDVTMNETLIHHYRWVHSSKWKLSKVAKDANTSRQGFGCLFCHALFFCSSMTLRKEEASITNIIYHFVCLRKDITQNRHKWRKQNVFVTKTMHHVTSWSQWLQNYINCTLTVFWTHPIL